MNKTGLDDFLASGKTEEDVLAYAKPEPTSSPPEGDDSYDQYEATKDGLFWNKSTKDGIEPVRLTNFSASISKEVVEDDGAETQRFYEIKVQFRGRTSQFMVPATSYASMEWVAKHLSAGATVLAGSMFKDRARVAIQLLSGEPPTQRVFSHTGWRRMPDGNYGYVHGGGVIGENSYEDVSTRLPNGLEVFDLPAPTTDPEETKKAIRCALKLLELGPPQIIIPLLAAVFRAVMGSSDFALFLVGPSGVFKTELAAFIQAFFGRGFNARNLPGSWSSTENALEMMAFVLKDAIYVVDDFAPSGSQQATQKLQSKAERIIRAQGNNSGRHRLNGDTLLRPSKPPRGMILGTGEAKPQGYSIQARLLEPVFTDFDSGKADHG